jgi:hypothetical protein
MVGPREGSRSLSIPPDLKDAGGDGKMLGGFPSPATAQKTGSLSWRRGSLTPAQVVLGDLGLQHQMRITPGATPSVPY